MDMKKTQTSKLRVLWLTTASSLVLLSGCQTYKNFSRNFMNERPAQNVEGERRMPLLNAQRPMPGQALPPGVVPSPQMAAPVQKQAAAPQGAPTPYDMFDDNGNEVDAPEPSTMPAPAAAGSRAAAEPSSAPAPSGRVITANDAHFISNNNMNPPATGAAEKSDGNLFGRLFASKQEAPGARKPIPGNPQSDMATSMVAPVPQGPLDGVDHPKSAPVALSSVPSSQEPQVLGRLSDESFTERDMPDAPSKPLLENTKTVTAPVAERAIKAEAEAEVNNQVATRSDAITFPPRVVLEPKGAIPLVEAMPVDPESYNAMSSRAGAPAASQPQPVMEAPRSQDVEPMANTHSEVQTESPKDAAVPEAAAAAPRSPEQLPEQAKAAAEPAKTNSEDDMFMPVTDFQTKEEGTVVTVSTLADKQKKPKEKGFFDRMLSGDDSADAKKPSWIERQFSGEDTRTPEQKKPYPGFGAVPQKPEQFDEVQSKTTQHRAEMESALDQAQESKMELNNEPSSAAEIAVVPQPPADVAAPVAAQVPAPAPAPAPVSSEQPKLLGQITAPPPQFDNEPAAVQAAPVAPAAAAPAPAPAAMAAPAATKLTPLVAPMGMDGADHQAMTVPPAPSAPVAAPQPAVSEIAPAQPAMQAEAPKVETPKADMPAQPEAAPAPVAVMPQPAPAEVPATVAIEPPAAAVPAAGSQDAPASADKPAVAGSQQLPSPALLDKVRVLPPSRYENRRLPQAN